MTFLTYIEIIEGNDSFPTMFSKVIKFIRGAKIRFCGGKGLCITNPVIITQLGNIMNDIMSL